MQTLKGKVEKVIIFGEKPSEFNGKQVVMCNVSVTVDGTVACAYTSKNAAEGIKEGDEVEITYEQQFDKMSGQPFNQFKMKDGFVNISRPKATGFGSKFQPDPAKDLRISYMSIFGSLTQACKPESEESDEAYTKRIVKMTEFCVRKCYSFKIEGATDTTTVQN